MRHKTASIGKEGKSELSSDEEPIRTSLRDDNMPLTSTPIKGNERRSVSLLDITDIGSNLESSKINISSDTLGSSSSICKDSGYNHSESSLSEKVKDNGNFPVDFRAEYFRLLEDLKFKDLMISSLYESNHSLRMKMAEAENKIFELRVKSESHCKCCMVTVPKSSVDYKSDNSTYQNKYSVSPLTKSEPCLLLSPTKKETKPIVNKGTKSNEPSTLPCDNSYMKVKQWQNTYKECQKRLASNIPPTIPNAPVDTNKIFFRPVPEPLPQSMSYMETSRALAEAYRRRQEMSPDLFSFQVIGDHQVAVSPVQFVRGCHVSEGTDSYSSVLERSKYRPKAEARKEMFEQSSGRQSLVGNIFFRNQELLRRSTILDTIPLQRPQTRSLNTKSNGLFDCLTKANEYAASLTVGLSKLPDSLDEIRSSCGMSFSLHDSWEIITAFAYVVLSIIFVCFVHSFF